MKRENILVIFFFILLLVFGFFIFLIKKQNLNTFRLGNIFQGNQPTKSQADQTDINQSSIPTSKPISQGMILEINEPKNNAVYNSPSIKVSGKTSANAEVYVNDIETIADLDGNFSINYNLDEGENLLTVVVGDSVGNYAEKEITVYLQTQE